MTTATHNEHDNTPAAVLFMAFKLRENSWRPGCSMGHGQQPRAHPLTARALKRLLDEVVPAKTHFGLCATVLGAIVTQQATKAFNCIAFYRPPDTGQGEPKRPLPVPAAVAPSPPSLSEPAICVAKPR
jgi:hypothetical protein